MGLLALASLVMASRVLTAAADISGTLGIGNFRVRDFWRHRKVPPPVRKRMIPRLCLPKL